MCLPKRGSPGETQFFVPKTSFAASLHPSKELSFIQPRVKMNNAPCGLPGDFFGDQASAVLAMLHDAPSPARHLRV